ncbi:MAG TPA: glutamate mutase L, partial [Bacilli bacterium]|nr:glutamate mutase L [Bacilli bacterium]
MKYLLLDFGSTYTKLTAVDISKAKVIGHTEAITTINT